MKKNRITEEEALVFLFEEWTAHGNGYSDEVIGAFLNRYPALADKLPHYIKSYSLSLFYLQIYTLDLARRISESCLGTELKTIELREDNSMMVNGVFLVEASMVIREACGVIANCDEAEHPIWSQLVSWLCEAAITQPSLLDPKTKDDWQRAWYVENI